MKHVEYVVIALLCAFLLASCTEENVKPQGDGDPIGIPPPPPPGGGG